MIPEEAKHFTNTGASRRRIIVHTPEPGAGAGQYVAEFVGGLAAAGGEVKLFCPANFCYCREVAASGVEIIPGALREVEPAPLRRRVSRNLVFAFNELKNFWACVRRDDIVHFQFALHMGVGLLFFLVARVKGAFVVLTVHDPLPHRWILPRSFRWLETTFLSIGYSFCHRLIVHNQTGRRILVDQFDLDANTVAVIPHGPLNVAPLTETRDGQLAEKAPLRLLMFGSLRENKGLHLAICAIQRLRRLTFDRSVCLTIAGQIPNSMEASYWDACKGLIDTQPDGIEVIERVIDDEEIGRLFARHDAVLLPYGRFFSDSGVAMLALSQKLPILATGAGGLGELLNAGDCGIFIDAATVEAVVAGIEKAISAPAGWLQEKGLNGYNYALSMRSWNAIGRQTLELYDALFDRDKRIVLHTPEPYSSAALYVESLSKALAADGVALRVVCPANHLAIGAMQQEASIQVRTSVAREIEKDVSLLRKIWDNLRFVVSSVRTLFAATNPGDIVHFQYILHLPFGLVFFLCAWLRRAQIVFTVHDPLPHKFLFPAALRGVEMTGLRWAYQWSDVLIVHSEAGKRKLLESFRLPPEKVRVIVHGPYELKERVRPCPETHCLEVLFFGSLRENKAPHLAIQAVQQLAAEGLAIRLTVAGQVMNRKEESYWMYCRSLIDPSCGAIRLINHFVPDEDLPELFSNCHCLVLPYTSFSSDSGVAYMAMANGKPIVSTGAGGLGWLLENSHGGITISEATLEGVAAALRAACEIGPANLERIGSSGAEWMIENCGWRQVARETRAVYAEWIPQLAAVPQGAEPLPQEMAPVEIVS